MSGSHAHLNLNRIHWERRERLAQLIEEGRERGDPEPLADYLRSLDLRPLDDDEAQVRRLSEHPMLRHFEVRWLLLRRLRLDPAGQALSAAEKALDPRSPAGDLLGELAFARPGANRAYGDLFLFDGGLELMTTVSSRVRPAYTRLWDAEGPRFPLVADVPALEEALGGLDPDEGDMPRLTTIHDPTAVQRIVRELMAFSRSFAHEVPPPDGADMALRYASHRANRKRKGMPALERPLYEEELAPLEDFVAHYQEILCQGLSTSERDDVLLGLDLRELVELYVLAAGDGHGLGVYWGPKP